MSIGLRKDVEKNNEVSSSQAPSRSRTPTVDEVEIIGSLSECHHPEQPPHFQDASWNEFATKLRNTTAEAVEQVMDNCWRKMLSSTVVENGHPVGGISAFLHELVSRLQADSSDGKFKRWLGLSRILPVMLHMVRFVIRIDPSKPKVCKLLCSFGTRALKALQHLCVYNSPHSIKINFFFNLGSNGDQRDDRVPSANWSDRAPVRLLLGVSVPNHRSKVG